MAALEPEKPSAGEEMKDLGLSLAPAAKFPGAGEEGVVITDVDPASDAADKGLKPGDVILQVAGVNVSEPSDVAAGVKKGHGRRQDREGTRSRSSCRSKPAIRRASWRFP